MAISTETLKQQYDQFIANNEWREYYGYDATPEDFVLVQTTVEGSNEILKKADFMPLSVVDGSFVIEHVDGLPLVSNITTEAQLATVVV